MSTVTGSRITQGVALVLLSAHVSAAQQTVLSVAPGPLSHPAIVAYRAADAAGAFPVNELPSACTITINGSSTADWESPSCTNAGWPQTFSNSGLTVSARMLVSHNAGPRDALYVFISINGAGNNTTEAAADSLVLMLDTQHTHFDTSDDVGLCFKRNPRTMGVTASLTGSCSAITTLGPVCGAASRWCISSTAGQWTIEAKLYPDDFELGSFTSYWLGTIGGLIRAVDDGGVKVAVGPGVQPSAAMPPAEWANLDLRFAVDVVLVLDLSGSMGALACPVPCPTKLDLLKEAVDQFLNVFEGFGWEADRISVIYFKTNITEYPTAGNLVQFLTNVSTIGSNVEVTSAGGATALGGGLQTAINVLSTSTKPGRKRHVILFSDGMQNVNPMVVDDGAGNLHIENVPGRPASGVSPESPATLLQSTSYNVHTIGIDATEPFIALMSSIANETGGRHQNNPNATETAVMLIQTLVDAMSPHGSPQLLAFRRGTLTGDTATETFTVNRGVRRILFETSWSRGKRLSFQVFKNGKNVTAMGRRMPGPSHQGFVVDLPLQMDSVEVAAEGEWQLVIQGQPGTTYETAALVDEPALKYTAGTRNQQYTVGETIGLTAEVHYAGAPIDDAHVVALVGKPGQGIGTLLSVNPTPATAPSVSPEPQATPAQAKLQLLLEDADLWPRIQPVNRAIELKSVGNGKYEGTFNEADVTGAYPIRFLISGETPEIGKYRRTHSVAAVVRFGPADPDLSEIEVRTIEQTVAGTRALLHLRPKDRFGNYLGPDFADRIKVSLSEGTVIGKPRDLLDGSYEIELLLPANMDPAITITVVEHPLFHGKVSQARPRQFALSLHAGVSLPHGSFNTTHDPGFGITADAEYWWNRKFAVAALLGYHRFGGEGVNPDLDLFHASVAAEARVTTGSPSVLVDAGGGFYNFSPGGSDLGVHAGIGVEFDLSPTVALGATGRVHNVFTTGANTTFSSIQVGGKIRF